MDQKRIVGVGNIYASESLFLAKIKPNRSCKKMSIDDCSKVVKAIKKFFDMLLGWEEQH